MGKGWQGEGWLGKVRYNRKEVPQKGERRGRRREAEKVVLHARMLGYLVVWLLELFYLNFVGIRLTKHVLSYSGFTRKDGTAGAIMASF